MDKLIIPDTNFFTWTISSGLRLGSYKGISCIELPKNCYLEVEYEMRRIRNNEDVFPSITKCFTAANNGVKLIIHEVSGDWLTIMVNIALESSVKFNQICYLIYNDKLFAYINE